MMPEKAYTMLKSYKEYLGRCEYLKLLIDDLKTDAELWSAHATDELPIMGGQNLDGMPRGNAVGNPTERLGILLADGYKPAALAELEQKIADYELELRMKSIAVHFVDAWLSGLTEKERTIVKMQVIDQSCWREVVAAYKEKFGDEYSKEGLKRIRDRALEKIYIMAQ